MDEATADRTVVMGSSSYVRAGQISPPPTSSTTCMLTTTGRRPRRRRVGVATFLAAVGLPATVAVADSSSEDTTVSCGSVITTDVRLAADLVDCPAAGLVVGAPGITIDLNGHVIDGTGSGVGIDNNGRHDDIRITGGRVTGFGQGVDLLETSGARVDRMTFEANAIGVSISNSDHVVVDRVDAVANEFTGMSFSYSEHLIVTRNAIKGSEFGGIFDEFSVGNRYDRNRFTNNRFFGLRLELVEQAVLTRNTANDNEFDGIRLGFWTIDTMLRRNRADGNGADGFVIEEPGNTLRRNEAFDNGGVGIAAPADTIDGGRNRAAGNAGGDCTGVACG
jgi:parallel beta-helix repeat protein